jgi:hypothetical protein
MQIIGVPDHVDRAAIRPTIDWPLSARCQRELALRDETIAEARGVLSVLSDKELRVKVAAELADELRTMGGGDPAPGFPNAFTMTRDELLDFLAECVAGFDPDIEVVYPGGIDPTP